MAGDNADSSTAGASLSGDITNSHIYYGKIKTDSSGGDAQTPAVCEDGPVSGVSLDEIPSNSLETGDDGDVDSTVERHREMMKAFETHMVASSFKTAAPTQDVDVRDALRRMGEPITLFGEGPYERRARLKGLLAEGRTIPPPDPSLQEHHQKASAPVAAARVITVTKPQRVEQEAEPEQPEIEGTFYTEGTPSLLEFRRFCSSVSGPAAHKRLKTEQLYRQHSQQLQQQRRLSCLPFSSPILDMYFFNKFLQRHMALSASVVGDERPLTCCKFSAPCMAAVRVAEAAEDSTGALKNEEKDVPLQRHKDSYSLLATASWGETVKIWNPWDGRLLLQLRQHLTRVHSIAWNPLLDERAMLLASGSADSSICLWDLSSACKNGNCISSPSNKFLVGKLEGHEERVNRVSFHPTGRYLASTSHDETWRLWDLEKRQEILLQEGHSAPVYAICFHPDGSVVVTSDLSGLVKVTDLRVGRGVMDIAAHVKQVIALSIHPVCANWTVTGGDDNCVKLWDLRKVATTSAAAQAAAAGQGSTAAACISEPLLTIPAHTKMVTNCIFEPQLGRCLFTSSFDGLVKIWSCTDFSLQKSLPAHDGKVMGIDVHCSALGENGSKLDNDSFSGTEHDGFSTANESGGNFPANDEYGGQTIASVGFDRTWKLWKCEAPYSQKAVRDQLFEDFKEAQA